MNSLLNALAGAGLASNAEVQCQSLAEQDEARNRLQKFLPKTIAELMQDRRYNFFARVGSIVEFLEADASLIDEALAATAKHLAHGAAGKIFLQQLEQLKVGTLGISELKAKWPKVFAK